MPKMKGMVVSEVHAGDKGVGMRIMLPDFGDALRVFVPADRVVGEKSLKPMDKVVVTYKMPYANGREIGLNEVSVALDNGKV